MKVRHTLLAVVVLLTTTLGISAPSTGIAEAMPLPLSTARLVAHPSVVRPPTVVKTTVHHTAVVIPRAVRTFGRCVINHESRYAKPSAYRAQNPTSTASGAYQFTNRTWRHYQRLAGFGHRYSRARYAPPWVQDRVFAYVIKHHAYYHWRGTHCGHGT